MSRKAQHMANVAQAIQRASSLTPPGGWTVVVCPDGSDFHSAFQSCAGGAFPGAFSGRTAVMPDKSRVSVLPVSSTPFINMGPFDVMFVGWADDHAADNRRMSVWRAAAQRVLS